MERISETFKDGILQSGYVLDPNGLHHELSSGVHGKKLHFDKILTTSALFDLWVASAVHKLGSLYDDRELEGAVLLSVASGTNRLVGPVVDTLDSGSIPLLTRKSGPKTVEPDDEAASYLETHRPGLTIVVEDVGTSGSTTLSAVESVHDYTDGRVECLITWQRRQELEYLAAKGIVYHAIIKEPLQEYSPEACNRVGYCSRNERLITR